MLGAFALVALASVLGGFEDKVRAGFKGLSWDATVELRPRAPGGAQWAFVTGTVPEYHDLMNGPVVSGRGLTEADRRRRSPVAVLGASLAARYLGGADPVGRHLVVQGVQFQVVGVLAPRMIFSEQAWRDANGILVPLETCMDRLDPGHRLDAVTVKLKSARDLRDAGAAMLARARRARHGIDDVELKNLDEAAARSYQRFRSDLRNWRTVFGCLAGTVLLVGGVGVLSVMLIACSERRFEIGLRKALGASDRQILGQFLLEAGLLGALGALGGTGAAAVLCRLLAHHFPAGLAVAPASVALAWLAALGMAVAFGLYPALRAMGQSPATAMR